MKFLCPRHAAEFDLRLPARLFRRHPGAQVVFDAQRQMAFQLFGEFALAPRTTEQTEKPHEPAAHLSDVHCDSLPAVAIQCGARSADQLSSPAARESSRPLTRQLSAAVRSR